MTYWIILKGIRSQLEYQREGVLNAAAKCLSFMYVPLLGPGQTYAGEPEQSPSVLVARVSKDLLWSS